MNSHETAFTVMDIAAHNLTGLMMQGCKDLKTIAEEIDALNVALALLQSQVIELPPSWTVKAAI
jgi:hypothetical protein